MRGRKMLLLKISLEVLCIMLGLGVFMTFFSDWLPIREAEALEGRSSFKLDSLIAVMLVVTMLLLCLNTVDMFTFLIDRVFLLGLTVNYNLLILGVLILFIVIINTNTIKVQKYLQKQSVVKEQQKQKGVYVVLKKKTQIDVVPLKPDNIIYLDKRK